MKSIKSIGKFYTGRKRARNVLITGFVLLFGGIGIWQLLITRAAGEELYLTPETNNVTTGGDITVVLRANSSTGINGVETWVDYNKDHLQFKSIDVSASSLTTRLIGEVETEGSVHIVQAIPSVMVNGDFEIAKITFTAISPATTTSNLTIRGEVGVGDPTLVPAFKNAVVNITAPSTPARASSFTIKPSVAAPVVGTAFGLQVYASSETAIKGGEVTVKLPSGLAAQAPYLTTTNPNTAFSPASIVDNENFDTNAQTVYLVFSTQSTDKTGEQLIGTIPVVASTVGPKQVTFENGNIYDLSSVAITPVTADAFAITVNAASLPAATVRLTGGSTLAATTNVTNLRQSFTITNFDSGASYTVKLGERTLTMSGDSFSIPTNLGNGNYTLQITSTKNGASGNASFTIRLRSPNVNRIACTNIEDLFRVNDAYGAASAEYDLNFDDTVGLIDLMTVIQRWGGECVD